MKNIINKIIIGAFASITLLVTANAGQVSSPYTNTFDTEASTNDFFQGFSKVGVGERTTDQYWKWDSLGYYQNYIYTGRGLGNSYNWSTLDFGGDSEAKRNFSIQSDMQTKCNDGGPDGLVTPFGMQGLCALASDEIFTNNATYYYGRVYFTNVVGTVQISKFDGGVENVLTNVQTTIQFERWGLFNMKLEGTYEGQSGNDFLLTYSIWDDSVTNTVSVIDDNPLVGTWFGYRDYAVRDGLTVKWDNLVVEVDIVHPQGTVIILK